MNMQRKIIKILILLKLIIYGYLFILYNNIQIKTFEISQNFLKKIKTFEFLIKNQLYFQINRNINHYF